MAMGVDLFAGLLGGPQMMLALLVFLAAATLTFSVMAGARVRSEVRRRAAGWMGVGNLIMYRMVNFKI